jgi:PIN domain nuclease of toxin-antitoxin system
MKRLMLDTHTLLWAVGDSKELSPKAQENIIDSRNDVLVSAVSLWEIAIKYSKDPFDRMLIQQCIRNKYTLVSRDSKMKFYEKDGLDILW